MPPHSMVQPENGCMVSNRLIVLYIKLLYHYYSGIERTLLLR